MIRFRGYRPNPPADYRAKGIAAPESEPQYEGVIFGDGTVVLRWQTEYRSHSVWASFEDFYQVHGHPEYGTRIVFLDDEAGIVTLCGKVSRDQDRYVQILDHVPVGSGSFYVCSMCGGQAQVLDVWARTRECRAIMHRASAGPGDCPGSKQPLNQVDQVDESDAGRITTSESVFGAAGSEKRKRLVAEVFKDKPRDGYWK